jgi:DNA mismatch repair protein MutS2
VLSLQPAQDEYAALERHGLLADLMLLRNQAVPYPELRCPDTTEVLRRLRPVGSVLSGEDLVGLRWVLETVERLCTFVRREPCLPLQRLQDLAGDLDPCRAIRKRLDQSLDDDGLLLDSASPELARLRRQIQVLEQEIQATLNRITGSSEVGEFLQDRYVTVRNDRFVVPVRREHRSRVDGIVHDHSDSGKTLFVEVQQTVPMGNELTESRLLERDECRRILAQLSDLARDALPALAQDLEVLARLDAGMAISLWADEYGCILPEFSDNLVLKHAEHPLLKHQFRQQGEDRRLVPLDLAPRRGRHVLVITGSNSGGKTVTLKTVGLLTVAAEAGLPVPVAPGTEFRFFADVLADIGDEQSLQQNLSTFTGHMARISGILRAVDDRKPTLVLLDELGAGTDPVEGGVLACAILESLAKHRTLCLATTHLGVVKTFAHEHRDMDNAAVRFNPRTLEPEYRLELGRPGASHALSIAARMGLPRRVLDHANALLGEDNASVESMLVRLEEDQREMSARRREAETTLTDLEQERNQVRQELKDLRKQRKALLHEAHHQAERTAENARREVEQLLAEIRAAETREDRAKAADKARTTLQERAADARKGAEQTAPRPERPLKPARLRPGDRVWVQNLSTYAQIEHVSADHSRVTVTAGALRFEVDARELGKPDQTDAGKTAKSVHVSLPRSRASVPAELNLIGERVDEAQERLRAYLDQAVLAGLPSVRVVHGFGTGRLQRGVHEVLRGHRHVERFSLGEAVKEPGGNGVTLVVLRG